MRITYFTVEDISSSLFRNQVVNKINAIIGVDPSISFDILIFNNPIKYFKHKKILNEYKNTLSEKINIRYYPIMPPLRFALSNILHTKFILIWMELFCRIFIKVDSDIIHCRSYWPTFTANKVFNIPILFDLRSLFPAENVAAGNMKLNSRVYKYWLKIEEKCINDSAVNSAVSEAMVTYISKISSNSVIHLNPIIVNTNDIFFDFEERKKIRKKLGWEEKIILVYSGSLGVSGVNKSAIEDILKLFSKLDNRIRFLFLSSEREKSIENLLQNAGINEKNYFITETSSQDLYKWLSASDIGFHALPYQLDSDTRLGTKVVEYWVSGLPVIINKNVGAAVDIISKYDLGLVIDEHTNFYEELFDELKLLLTKNRSDISKTAKSMFDSNLIAKKYIISYKECLKNNKYNKNEKN